jgi:hypothetical protein
VSKTQIFADRDLTPNCTWAGVGDAFYSWYMADPKQSMTVGEFFVAAKMARRVWAPALTRDASGRTDIARTRTTMGPFHFVDLAARDKASVA